MLFATAPLAAAAATNFVTSTKSASAAYSSACNITPRAPFSRHESKPSSCMMSSSSLVENGNDAMTITGYLGAEDAALLDAELMSSPGFGLEQLMELAGLSVAEAVYAAYPPNAAGDGSKLASEEGAGKGKRRSRVVLVCGPGNNGGDGLVAARHLVHFGYDCVVVYPKKSQKMHFVNLVKQCEDMDIPILEDMPKDWTDSYDVVVDAIFGFSFWGEPREPFASILKDIVSQNLVSVVSVDVPSGWNVDEGDVSGMEFMPDVLVSLTSPKKSSLKFTGRHFVGGRFLPPALAEKYGIRMPPYPGVSQVMEMPRSGDGEKCVGQN